MAKYANVIIDITTGKLDRTFQYLVPENLQNTLQEGMQVYVQFGNAKALKKAFVVELTDNCEYFGEEMKPISRIAEDAIPVEAQMIQLAAWIRDHFGGTMNQALKTVLPVKQQTGIRQEKTVVLTADREEAVWQLEQYRKKKATARVRLLQALLQQGSIPMQVVTGKLGVTAAVVKALEQQGILKVISERKYRNPLQGMDTGDYLPKLNVQQQYIVDEITADLEEGKRQTYLIHGVTGSGKTEVYMELIDGVIKRGRQAIVLIPEIALTFQTVMRFYRRFGDRVTLLHSKMSPGERFDQMQRAKNGEADVCIGPRSALFTPFTNLGLIIIDEEHEASYKSETVPRYHARETAIKRAELAGASVVLGSATPSLESYYRCETGEYRLFSLADRFEKRPLPKVDVVDLRQELKNGNRSVFSERLRELLKDRLCKGEQAMLFLNRRGMAGFVSCRSCGYVVKCPHCDVSLTSHGNGKLVCHYCGYETPHIAVCPQCGSKYIGGFKAGTEKIEELVKKEFPGAKVLRMDADTTKQKGGYESIIQSFADREADILIGTQMIVKGHDFPGVTLVGVLAADLSLHAGDFRAAEKTFQLLTQAAGRAGRGDVPGEVVIQTYSPQHYSVQAASRQDYQEFYQSELPYRRLLGYPPVANMMVLHIFSERDERAKTSARVLSKALEDIIRRENINHLRIVGPANATISKVADIYHKVIYVKHDDYEILVLLKKNLEEIVLEECRTQNVNIQFDFNPMF